MESAPNEQSAIEQDLFGRAFESSPNAIVIVNREGVIILANAQAEEMFGYSRAELLQQPVEMLIPKRFLANHSFYLQQFMRSPKRRAMGAGRDLYGSRIDGSEFPIEIGLNPIRTRHGLFTLTSIIDITERKRAEERFRLVVEAAPNAMLMVGREGRIILVNAQLEQLFGYPREELLGQSIELLVPERSRDHHPAYRTKFFSDPAARRMGAGRDLHGRRRDGSEVPIEIGLNPLETPEGVFTLASIIDITERRRMDEELRRRNAELEALLNVVSHDLKEPLRSVTNFAQLLTRHLGDDLDARGEMFIEKVMAGTTRMGRLLDDVLELSRARSDEATLEETPLQQLVDEAKERLEFQIQESGARLEILGEFPTWAVEPTWITQALFNLLSNALKYTRPGEAPDVEIEALRNEDSPDTVSLVVRDRGTGIDAKLAERVFQLFQRGDSGETEGTGAGLAIVKAVAERHSGRAFVRPRTGGGSEFVVVLGSMAVDLDPEAAADAET